MEPAQTTKFFIPIGRPDPLVFFLKKKTEKNWKRKSPTTLNFEGPVHSKSNTARGLICFTVSSTPFT